MTTTAHEDQFTAEPEPVRQPYDTGSILRRNVADLELALKQQAELAEAAEAELLAVREDNHIMMVEIDELRKELAATAPNVPTDEQIHAAYRNALGQSIRERDMPEIRKFARALMQSASTGVAEMNWQERAEKAESELAKLRNQKPVAYVKYKATGGNVGLSWFAIPTQVYYPREGEPLYAAPVHAPAVPDDWREVMAELAADLQASIEAEHAYRDQYSSVMRKYQNDMRIVERARALLQSAEVTK